jgi:hypothetical protein
MKLRIKKGNCCMDISIPDFASCRSTNGPANGKRFIRSAQQFMA